MRALSCFVAVALAIVARPAHGEGGPPLLTDDPGTPGANRWEVNVAATSERTARGWLWDVPLLDLNYGVGARVQLKYEVPLLLAAPRGGTVAVGVGNSLAGIKVRFLDEETTGLALSVYPQLELDTATPSVGRDLAQSGTSLLLPLQASRALGPIEANIEVGYEATPHERGRWVHGLALGHATSDRLELLAEVFGAADSDLHHELLIANLGGRLTVAPHLRLLFSAGRGVAGAHGERPGLLTYIGLQWLP